MKDLRDYDYPFYLQNRANFAADMKLVRADKHLVGNVLGDDQMWVWQKLVKSTFGHAAVERFCLH
jgi:hypothetical protein